MLIVHPSSTCDVCLDGYSWATPANTPHAISCGHVFCLQSVIYAILCNDVPHLTFCNYRCLHSTYPMLCPLCRRAFNADQIKKLHVDRSSTVKDRKLFTATEESELIRRVALFFGENSSSEDANAVIDEVHEWLAARSHDPTTVSPSSLGFVWIYSVAYITYLCSLTSRFCVLSSTENYEPLLEHCISLEPFNRKTPQFRKLSAT